MQNILIAGAGHGGLAAGILLARAGFSVTLAEQKARAALGHDWEDRFTFPLLADLVGRALPPDVWRCRGDCAFVSPAKRKRVVVRYTDETRQRIMWRKPLLGMLLTAAEEAGVKILYGVRILGPLVEKDRVVGLETDAGPLTADLVIDAAGVFSPVRQGLPAFFGIEARPRRGDLFYAYRAYFDRLPGYETPDAPFEVYLYHEGEKGLSWFGTNDETCDVLLGRIDPLTDEKLRDLLSGFRREHPWCGEALLHGGTRCVIPVRRPLPLMVGNGYAAVGDSAFMTTPMNGMGIDLSLQAGRLLAETVTENRDRAADASVLWDYNRAFHRLYGGAAAKNEGLKNTLLTLSAADVDFFFESAVIEASDLAGAGGTTKLTTLLAKFGRGMRQPPAFFTLLGGLIRGAKVKKLYENAPVGFDRQKIAAWGREIEALDIRFDA